MCISILKPYRSSSNGIADKEKTLAIIKPDGLLGNYTDRIKKTILEHGFSINKEKLLQLEEDAVARFYAEHSSKSFFSSLVKYMTRYHILIVVSMVAFNIYARLPICLLTN